MAEFDDVNFGDGVQGFGRADDEPLGDRFSVRRALRELGRNLTVEYTRAELERNLRNQEEVQILHACKRLLYSFWKEFNNSQSSRFGGQDAGERFQQEE